MQLLHKHAAVPDSCKFLTSPPAAPRPTNTFRHPAITGQESVVGMDTHTDALCLDHTYTSINAIMASSAASRKCASVSRRPLKVN